MPIANAVEPRDTVAFAAADLRAVTNAVPALISFFDAGHVCRFANAHHLQWYGRSPDELVGKHMRDFLGDERYASRHNYLVRVTAGQTVTFDAQVPHRDGGVRESAISYVPKIGVDGFEGFYILVFDIDRRKQEVAGMLDLAHDAILLRGLDDRISYWSAGCARSYGWASVDAIDRDAHQLLDARFAVPLPQIEAHLLETGSWSGEIRRRRSDGAEIIVSARWVLRRDDEGQPLEVLETAQDITSLLRAHDEIARANAALAHAARVSTLGELTASIAHEINQPLAAIVANGEAGLRWLRRAEPDIGEATDAMSAMIEDAKRASSIIARIRAMSKKRGTEKTTFACQALLDDAAAILRRELAEHGVTLHVEADAAPPVLHADRIQLQQVLINLMVNAMQAMATHHSRERSLVVRAYGDGTAAAFEVEDSGPGIDDEHLGQLFLAFFTTKADGMGIGLSICRTIVEAHGGAISVQRATNGGSLFRFTIPLPTPETNHTSV